MIKKLILLLLLSITLNAYSQEDEIFEMRKAFTTFNLNSFKSIEQAKQFINQKPYLSTILTDRYIFLDNFNYQNEIISVYIWNDLNTKIMKNPKIIITDTDECEPIIVKL